MKLWQKNIQLNKRVESFTIGKDASLDLLLAKYDVIGSIAHAIMLQSIGILSKTELKNLKAELTGIYKQVENGKFKIEKGIEDVHSQIEKMLTQKLGGTGERIHTGRSRNDQVLVDIRLFIRDEIKKIVQNTKSLFNRLIILSEKHKNDLLPGYTHLQIAMPSSFGLWFGAYAESLVDDLILLKAAYDVINKNPLGSAAGYGNSLPLDRKMTTELLGFNSLNYNVVYAQMTRGKVEKITASALASIASTIARCTTDICLYVSQNFNFFSLPENLSTGSSIMPHKKNPDVFELIRARCNKMQYLPAEIGLITTNLPSGYFRDLQITKELLFPAFEELNNCIEMFEFMLPHLKVRKNILDDEKYKYLFSVEAVNEKVMKGIPFREAYKLTAKELSDNSFVSKRDIRHTHIGSIGNLSNDKISGEMNKLVKSYRFENAENAIAELLR